MNELRALILDGEEMRVIRISGTLAEDDFSVLLVLSDYSDDPRSSERRRRRTIVLDLSDLTLEVDEHEEHHASNCLIVEIGHRALRGQWFECYGFPAGMKRRLRELFDAFGLEPPVVQ